MTTPTPRTDELVRELKRINAGDWTIDLIALAQKLERDLATAQEELVKVKAENSKLRSALEIVHFKREQWQ